MARRRQHVNALEGIFRVHVNRHRFFEPAVHGSEGNPREVRERRRWAGEGVGEYDAFVCFAGGDAQGVAVGDYGSRRVFDCFVLGCGEVAGFTVEEGGFGEVVLRVVGVFPDEEGGCGLDYVFASEEDADKAGCWEGFVGAVFGEFEGEVGEALGWSVLGRWTFVLDTTISIEMI